MGLISICIKLDSDAREVPAEVFAVLANSGVIAHATDTVYGLAARWDNLQAIRKISSIKKRSLQQPYSIMAGSVEEICRLIGWESSELRTLLRKVFPGAITLLLPVQKQRLPAYWNQFDYLGFRMPDHPLCRDLLHRCGHPLITTSANRSGQSAPRSADEIDPAVLQKVDLILDSGKCPLGQASTVVKLDWEKRRLEVLREGAVSRRKLDSLFTGFKTDGME